MKLLLDECLPRKLKREFTGHKVLTIDEAGFKGLKNGELIRSAGEKGFEVLVSVDKNIEQQQNKENLPFFNFCKFCLKTIKDLFLNSSEFGLTIKIFLNIVNLLKSF